MNKIVLVTVLITVSMYGSFSSKLFKNSIKRAPVSKMTKMVKELQSSKYIKKVIDGKSIKKLTDADILTKAAEAIAKKSPVNNRLMGVSNPMDAMYLYAKGGDKLFKNIDTLAGKTLQVSRSALRKAQKNLPTIPNVSKMTQKELLDKSVRVVKATGEKGLAVVKTLGKIAKENPKSAVAGILYGWFISDPNGFKNALQEFGGSVEAFAKHIGETIGETVGGVVVGFKDGMVAAFKKYASVENGMVLLAIVLVWLLFKFRSLFKLSFVRAKNGDAIKKNNKKRGGRF